MPTKTRIKRRDPERTREAILDAAENLFVDRGYGRTTMEAIGHSAGVSRGAPGYFFGSKLGLYHAVVERLLTRQLGSYAELRNRGADITLEEIIRALAATWRDPETIRARRLMLWEVLDPRTNFSDFEPIREASEGVLALLAEACARSGFPGDPRHALIAVTSLAAYPWIIRTTILPMIGVDVSDPDFISAYSDFLVSLFASRSASG
jgi:AcrR family transcriptional regulator